MWLHKQSIHPAGKAIKTNLQLNFKFVLSRGLGVFFGEAEAV